MPAIPRILYLAAPIPTSDALNVFTHVRRVQRFTHAHRPKFEAMLDCEFELALFIDNDTWFADSIEEVFDTLTRFDVALAPAPVYLTPRAEAADIYRHLEPAVSIAIPEWNGGVIAARVNGPFRSFVTAWSGQFSLCEALGFERDQAPLRTTLVASDLRVATLPLNYNFRVNLRQTVTREVKLLHGHGDLPRIAQAVNRQSGARHYTPNRDWLTPAPTAAADD